jgi:cell division protein FtsZ
LQAGVRGVTDLIVMPALINLDFADIRTAMMEMGKAMMGMGEGIGDRRAIEAAEAAINNPLLDDVSMKGARGVIINVTGGGDMTLFEVDEACNRIRDEVDPNANIIFGATFDEKMEGVMRVSIVATGIDVAEAQGRVRGGATTNSMINVLTSAQQQERKIDRTRPATTTAAPVQSEARSESYIPNAPVRTSTSVASTSGSQVTGRAPMQQPMMQQQHVAPVSQNMGSAMMGSAARKIEEDYSNMPYEAEIVETAPVQNYVTQTQPQSSQPRGTRYNDSFIPPAPIEAPVTRNVVEQPVYQTAQPVQQQHVQQPVQQPAQQPQNFLRPPVPGAVQPKKRAASLFERFTQGLRHEEEAVVEGEGETSGDTGETGGLRAAPRQSYQQSYQSASYNQAPQQGSLNIDAPVASRPGPQVDDELDIPAFLRRQAN